MKLFHPEQGSYTVSIGQLINLRLIVFQEVQSQVHVCHRYVQPLPLAPKGADPAGGTICINSGLRNILYIPPISPRDDKGVK